ncbi:TetR/AcrR family transcriptional regulator [Ottowia pentelensis]|uniref:TetR/AcrR family transcriptional regulator n=1 Tax=Ottowia pentelensis TaxID=511108 RepID=UPI00363BB4E3
MPSSTTKRSDPATRRAQLLDAADAVFTTHGVNAPLELVVQHAGVGRATLYRQFPDRHAILLALLERSAQRTQDRAQSLKDRPDAFLRCWNTRPSASCARRPCPTTGASPA